MRNPKDHQFFVRFARLSTGALAPTSFLYVTLVVAEDDRTRRPQRPAGRAALDL